MSSGRRIIITVQDKSGIIITEEIKWNSRPSVAITESIKKILNIAAINGYISLPDLFHIISFCSALNIPGSTQEKEKILQKEFDTK